MSAYQYLIIRYVHNISTEEFVNIGILLWVPEQQRIFHEVTERYSRLSNFFEGFNSNGYRVMIKQLRANLRAVQRNNRLLREAQSINEVAERVLSHSPSCFQWSEPMGGITDDPAMRVKAIFVNIVDRHYEKQERTRRSEYDIYRSVHRRLFARLKQIDLKKEIHEDVKVEGEHFGHTFKLGWQNGTSQFLEPISFDYTQGHELVEKAYVWSGRLTDLGRNQEFKMTGVVAPPREHALFGHYEEAIKILKESPRVREIVPEDEFDQFVPEIERDLAGA